MRERGTWEPGVRQVVKETLRNNKGLRFALVILAGLWIVLGTKLVTEKILYRERNLRQAVAIASPGSTKGTVSLIAGLQQGYLTETDQKQLIRFVADRIGLTLDTEPSAVNEANRSGYVYLKQAKYAETGIKVIAPEEKQGQQKYYLIVSLTLFEDDGEGAMYYKGLLSDLAEELAADQKQVSVQITGTYPHGMTLAARDRLTDRILKKLGCEIVCENREEELYTVYAYTKGMDEYIQSGNDRINVQLAMYYDEIKDETVLCVASPVITGELVHAD